MSDALPPASRAPTARGAREDGLRADLAALERVLEECHRLSALCARKFAILRWAMWSASLGLVLAWLIAYS